MVVEWEKCTEENYPQGNEYIVVRWAHEYDDPNMWYYDSYPDCGYGWSTLVRMNAEMIKIIKDK